VQLQCYRRSKVQNGPLLRNVKGKLMPQARSMLAMCIVLALVAPARVSGQATTATSSPSPPPNPSIPFRLLTTGAFTTPTPIPDPKAAPIPPPPPSVPSDRAAPLPAVLYILAAGGDDSTRQKFVGALAERLQSIQTLYSLNQRWNPLAQQQVHIVPEPSWIVSDYINACANSQEPNSGSQGSDGENEDDQNNSRGSSPVSVHRDNAIVAGALIVGINSISDWVDASLYIITKNKTRLMADLYYSACESAKQASPPSAGSASQPNALPQPITQHIATTDGITNGRRTLTSRTVTDYTIPSPTPTPGPKGKAYIAWDTGLWEATGHQRFFTPLSAISVIMTGIAVWSAFTPSVVKTTATVTAYPTPTPGVPIPPYGYVSGSTTTNQKTTNAYEFATVSDAFLSNGNNISSSQPLANTNDQTTSSAVDQIVTIFMFDRMRCPGRGQTSYQNPSSPCFAILTRRNFGTDAGLDTNYEVKDSSILQRAFNDCRYTYLQLKSGAGLDASKLKFFESDGTTPIPLSALRAKPDSDIVLIFGTPDIIALGDSAHALTVHSSPSTRPGPSSTPGPCDIATTSAQIGKQ
jgi:hypothetical protein